MPFLLFSSPLRWECSKTCFSENIHMIYSLLLVRCARAQRDAAFLLCLASNNASHPAWGSFFWIGISVVSTPLRWKCSKTFFSKKISNRFTYFWIVYCARAALAVTPLLGLIACGLTCLNKTLYLDTPVAWIVPSNFCLVSRCVIIWGGW